MSQSVFINLPVLDLARSRRFYESLGFGIDENFSDESAACVVISDTIHLMILTHPRFEGFSTLPRADTTQTTGVLVALSRDSREGVNDMLAAALAAGAREPKPADDHGWMFLRTFMDPDCNVFEIFWMDAEAALAARKLES